MKLTFVLPSLSLNGGIRVVADYGRELIRLGHEVAFVARRADRPRIRDVLLGRVKLGRNAEFLPEFFAGMEDRVRFVTSRRALAPSDLPDADFLIGTWWETIEWIREMPKGKGVRVHLMQGYEMFSWVPRDRVSRTYEEDTVKIAVSDWVSEQVFSNHGRRSAAVIHNAVDADRFPYKEKRPNDMPALGFMFSPIAIKNARLAFDLQDILGQRGVPVRLRTFHSGKLPRKIRSRTGLEAQFRPAQDQIPGIYQSCDLWLFTSLDEGFGLPILEALSCGTPVVATHAGAAPQLVRHGVNGYLAATDPQAFADTVMQHLALGEDRKRQMSRAARDSVLGWDWSKAAQKLVDTLSESGNR